MADEIRDWLVARAPNLDKCESPIERLFLATYEFMARAHAFPEGKDLTIRLEQQVTRGNYRLDFLCSVLDPAGERKYLAVELDGHDFHERTKEQAARDKKRDRMILSADIPTMRFTGSEVWGNPFACVEEVVSQCFALRYGRTPREAMARAYLDTIRDMLAEQP